MCNNESKTEKAFYVQESSIDEEQIIFLGYRSPDRENYEAWLSEQEYLARHGDD